MSAQSTFAEMKTGSLVSQLDGVGSSFKIYDQKRECLITNEHVVPKEKNKLDKSFYFNSIGDLTLDKPIYENEGIYDSNSETYSGKFIIYPNFFDAAVFNNPNKPCTREFIFDQIGIENILTIDKLIKRNNTEYKDQKIKITTHRNRDIFEKYDNKPRNINGKSIGITLIFDNKLVFLNFADSKMNNGLDPNQFLLKGTSGSPSYTEHIDRKKTVGLINTMFTIGDLKNMYFLEKEPGVYIYIYTLNPAEFVQVNPEIKGKRFLPAEDVIFTRLQELGYSNRQEFKSKKGIIFGITPFFSKEGLDQIPSEKDLQQRPNTPITKK